MRTVREKKLQHLREAIVANDEDNDGNIQYEELETLIRQLGYVPDTDAVTESAADAGISEGDNDLDLSELWRFLKVYRDREGLNSAELSEVKEPFDRQTTSGDISITNV